MVEQKQWECSNTTWKYEENVQMQPVFEEIKLWGRKTGTGLADRPLLKG